MTSQLLNSFVSGAPAQISCFKFGWMNPWWSARLDELKQPEWLFPDTISSKSQDLPDLYCPSGTVYGLPIRSLLAHQTFMLLAILSVS